ncbi:MAG: hypothetical protein CMH97_12060 [Oceanospirillaceae bacterium]|uniref:hypothetical protein n=1 Tax=Thalassolituus sp. UBA3500 TaxID=1947664 RepID=UPI000C0F9BB6|nr:hypothetical protein [Thalassolituus sp. UBA3500]MAE35935.1 hypothetical protein [Oceanospirillaceae bacterium]MBN59111.1 hypothetical protein [Oceanospirillaceae bacterium]|tara:strand:- start:361 stop:738 length:378 start_codon:yes stop_codon:yes gene_type:complete
MLISLKLTSNSTEQSFMASRESFRSRLQSAFILLAQRSHQGKAILEVKHNIHGWLKVCDSEHRYPIIQNPLLLDYGHLWKAVEYTLAEGDSWPTEADKQRLKLERQVKQRAEEAELRRRRFKVIK